MYRLLSTYENSKSTKPEMKTNNHERHQILDATFILLYINEHPKSSVNIHAIVKTKSKGYALSKNKQQYLNAVADLLDNPQELLKKFHQLTAPNAHKNLHNQSEKAAIKKTKARKRRNDYDSGLSL